METINIRGNRMIAMAIHLTLTLTLPPNLNPNPSPDMTRIRTLTLTQHLSVPECETVVVRARHLTKSTCELHDAEMVTAATQSAIFPR